MFHKKKKNLQFKFLNVKKKIRINEKKIFFSKRTIYFSITLIQSHDVTISGENFICNYYIGTENCCDSDYKRFVTIKKGFTM